MQILTPERVFFPNKMGLDIGNLKECQRFYEYY